MRLRRICTGRIVVGLLLGFLGRIVYEQINSSTKLYSDVKDIDQGSYGVDSANKPGASCPKCHMDQVCPICQPVHIRGEEVSSVLPAYKPKGMYEVTRWLYFDEHHVYDMINEEPKAPLSGYWKEETTAMIEVAMEYININQMMGQSWSLVALHNGYMRTDSMRGTDYILDLVVKPVAIKAANVTNERIFRVHLVHPLERVEDSKLLSIKRNFRSKIKIIVPISMDSIYVEEFIQNYVEKIDTDETEVILVLFSGDSIESARQSKEIKDKMSILHPDAHIKSIELKGTYNYYQGVQKGIELAADNEIVIAVPEDTFFTLPLLHHCRAIVEQQKRVYFPVAFAMYDPDIIEKGMPPGKPRNVKKADHTKFTGYWLHQTRDYICAYKSDLERHLSITKSEENSGRSLHDKFLKNDIEVFSAVVPNLFKLPNREQCQKYQPFSPQQKQCLKTKALSLGSKPALGMLYIREVLQR